ncbi:MAG: SDR family NAD(P)-dependent oxidoreductase [Anaerolineae bacterium]|jgi:glucose 1-dehydrogenase|nr:SDR family NAD(P)-dependent oxidoreductase [Anaerolineae bacterium]MDX9828921.1 SDR family oxidoreductase [Anaerolineae bacterium]
MAQPLQGRVALVTGASRGIGRGVALCLAERGAAVVVNYRSHAAEAEEVVQAIGSAGGRALAWQADVAVRDEVDALVQGAVEAFGRLDIAVANAAHSIRGPVVSADWEDVLRVLEVSQFGVFHTCQFAARQMLAQEPSGSSRGKIVIVSSILEELPAPHSGPYNMAKAAVNHLGRTLAAELARDRVNVNMVNPGWIDTPGERQFASEEALQSGGSRIPWGRLGTPDDIARAVAFLASDDADYITGATLRVDGGFLLGLSLPG